MLDDRVAYIVRVAVCSMPSADSAQKPRPTHERHTLNVYFDVTTEMPTILLRALQSHGLTGSSGIV